MNESDDIESSKAPLLDHLIELRKRMVYALLAMLVATVIGWFLAPAVYSFLISPLEEAYAGYVADIQAERAEKAAKGEAPAETDCDIDPKFHATYISIFEPFVTKLKLSLATGLAIGFPFIAAQIWAFIAPGLYRREKKAVLPFMLATPVLFLMGASLVYYLVMPLAWTFLLNLGTQFCAQLNQLIGGYLSLVIQMILAFGISFQLPVLLVLLARVGFVSASGLRKFRKYAIVGIFAFAAVVTPPDIISQMILGIPLVLLYELSLLGVRMVEKEREKSQEDGAPTG